MLNLNQCLPGRCISFIGIHHLLLCTKCVCACRLGPCYLIHLFFVIYFLSDIQLPTKSVSKICIPVEEENHSKQNGGVLLVCNVLYVFVPLL